MSVLGKKNKLNGVQKLAIGFAILIFGGAALLSLPISSVSGEPTGFIDSLFTSTSAVCVTGLITVDTGTHWNYFGKTIIMLLIEIGGLGFMAFTTLFAFLMGKKITLKERLVMQEAMNTFDIQGIVKMVRYILLFTVITQVLGAVLMFTQFIPQFGVAEGIFYAIFHSISAFCNAGFDLFGHFNSLTVVNTNTVIILTISILIIIGGLGFTVWSELYNSKDIKRISLHSKVVILITSILVIGGTILIFLFEFRNPNTLGSMSLKDKVINAFFTSVSPRTAGFNSISLADMTMASRGVTMILMFIGGSPGSTAGGLKTTTFGILILTVISVIKGRKDTEIFMKRLSKETVYRAFAIFSLAIGLVMCVVMILSFTETGVTFEEILFESVSAFGTAGLTMGITTKLSLVGKIVIMITMYCGRLGPMTVMLALVKRKQNSVYQYPEDKILVG
ncbi:MAG: TrkH family potassium uptake protein [Inconstantimicrobium porci]|uniref:Trk family potassium uptake protein n=1 Tax=Inconstantimicrobium porci TaxID=2652291 RepID=A0A7X2MVS3_9CLOT|nr:TrkH family potassium uptake protein [Inconstantimicrobium porci]MDD6770928.1 TrkH family potassium uptake protein [Inconstantimicrobium porci]MDY5912344.1 TrkH family potassium uptake protein [Inconstantimicrobium porci]MSR89981.1 Trk family potassium uptake protein [Inconstantimicrobium porci]